MELSVCFEQILKEETYSLKIFVAFVEIIWIAIVYKIKPRN